MQLAARRYFTSMLMAFGYQIDRYVSLTATKPSNVGTWAETETKKKYCKGGMYDDNPATCLGGVSICRPAEHKRRFCGGGRHQRQLDRVYDR